MEGVLFIDTLLTIPHDIVNLFQIKGKILKVEKGAHIFQEGEKAAHVYLIKNGASQISKETESGKELTIRICGPHCFISESLLFCKFIAHSTTAKALEVSELYCLSNDVLESFLNTYSSLLINYLKWIQTENSKNQSRLRDLVLYSKKGALYSTLIRLAYTYRNYQTDNEVSITIALTKTEVANLCATSREVINCMLTNLLEQIERRIRVHVLI